ncbi:chaperonin 10-like protein [Paraphoma chrysanthemicola]|nr:chaperonin 10-like protein [Paraphoma chrysanthemicola]
MVSKTTTQVEIPKKCLAGVVVYEGPNFLMEIEEVDVPEPGPDDILIKLNASGLCYSDIALMAGEFPQRMSAFNCRTPGHEGSGVVVKLGENVKNWKIGDRAGVKPIRSVCNACELCWDGLENYCRNATHSGNTETGTFQHYITAPAKYTTPIPDGVSDAVAAPLMCSGQTAYGALKNAALKSGNWVVFPGGGGGVGIQGVQIAKAMGFRPVVVDTGSQKRDFSLSRGAEAFVDFKESNNVAADVIRICDGIGAHGVAVTAAPAYKNAVSYVGSRVGATIMCIGLAHEPMTVGADPSQYVFSNLTVTGTAIGTQKDALEVLDFARRGLLQDISEARPLSMLPQSVKELRAGQIPGRIVIDFNL